MTASDVSETLRMPMTASDSRDLVPGQRPRLLFDNAPDFIADAFTQQLAQQGLQHAFGASADSQT